jgi:homoserine O-succinyltransferase/O-acetyltransferase
LVKVLDWADRNTHSTILSCLSAHAAVLHFDGIERRRLEDKCFGVFECTWVSDHLLTSGAPSRFPMPHSRWNDIPDDQLMECGYRCLTRLSNGGVDSFVKKRSSLFVCFQGHPEYEADTLWLEYRRDVGRYLRRETEHYPSLPVNYLGAETTHEWTVFQERARRDRRSELLAGLAPILPPASYGSPWRAAAVPIYGNWLAYLCAQQERRLARSRVKLNLVRSAVES